MFNNFKKDPLAESVKQVMAENEARREIEKALNEELGIQNRKSLPHELKSEYDAILEGRISSFFMNMIQAKTKKNVPEVPGGTTADNKNQAEKMNAQAQKKKKPDGPAPKAPALKEDLNPVQEEIRRNIILQLEALVSQPNEDKVTAYINGLTEDQRDLIGDVLEEATAYDNSTRVGAAPGTVVSKNPAMIPAPVSTPTAAQKAPQNGKSITPPVIAPTAKEVSQRPNPVEQMASVFRVGGIKAAGAKTLKPGAKGGEKKPLNEEVQRPKMSLENMLRQQRPGEIPVTKPIQESFESFLRTKLPEE